MGDCLRNLWTSYQNLSVSRLDLQLPLTAFVQQLLRHSGFAGGVQQDAAECLMHLLQAVDEEECRDASVVHMLPPASMA